MLLLEPCRQSLCFQKCRWRWQWGSLTTVPFPSWYWLCMFFSPFRSSFGWRVSWKSPIQGAFHIYWHRFLKTISHSSIINLYMWTIPYSHPHVCVFGLSSFPIYTLDETKWEITCLSRFLLLLSHRYINSTIFLFLIY